MFRSLEPFSTEKSDQTNRGAETLPDSPFHAGRVWPPFLQERQREEQNLFRLDEWGGVSFYRIIPMVWSRDRRSKEVPNKMPFGGLICSLTWKNSLL